MIHIVFAAPICHSLKEALALNNSLDESVYLIKGDYMFGPIAMNAEVFRSQLRKEWWRDLASYLPYNLEDYLDDDYYLVLQIIQKIIVNRSERICIWLGQNAHDLCGYYWLLPQLIPFQQCIDLVHLNNIALTNEQGKTYYPNYLQELDPNAFLIAMNALRTMEESEFNQDVQVWETLCKDNAVVRILATDKNIFSTSSTHFDADILESVSPGFQKLPTVIGNILGRIKEKTAEAFLIFRIHKLREIGLIEIQGSEENDWNQCLIRLK